VPAANRGHRSSRSTSFFCGTQLRAAPTFPFFAAQQHAAPQQGSFQLFRRTAVFDNRILSPADPT
jgi:hypothetical protein